MESICGVREKRLKSKRNKLACPWLSVVKAGDEYVKAQYSSLCFCYVLNVS